MRTESKDGSVLLTGNDMMEALRMSYNKRNNYTERDCSFCINEGNEDICDDCSVTYNEVGC